MKMKWLMVFIIVVALCGVAVTDASDVKEINIPFRAVPGEVRYVPDEFIIVLSQGVGTPKETNYFQSAQTGIRSLDLLAENYAVEYMKPLFPRAAERGIALLSRHYKVKFSSSYDLQTVMDAYAADPAVERVEPDGIHFVDAVPNDGNYSLQWHLNHASDHDIDAQEAWNIETGDSAIIVAILDTGVRYYHKDLGGANASSSSPGAARGNMWINWAEKNGSAGVDDDSNGYTDDWIGYDFVDGASDCWPGEDCNTKDNDPRDFNGHGTHCAGNVGAINNNGYATCAPSGGWGNGSLEEYGNGVEVMSCRVGWSADVSGEERGYVRMSFCAEAFYYAADNGAMIASCSWGSSNSGGIDAAATYFTSNGGLIFAAAGNDNDEVPSYLSTRSDVISVAATDENDCKASFSCYGTWVDISAPGVNIRSCYHSHDNPDNDYVAYMSGTSAATPLAASVAALVWSKNPSWTAAQVRQRVLDNADYIDDLGCNAAYAGKLGSGRINANRAITCCLVDLTDIDFDWLYTGETRDTTFTLINAGCGTLIGTVTETCDHFSIVSGASYNIANGDSHTVVVRYEPTAAGTHNCTVETGSLDCSDVSLTGEALPPLCEVKPDSLDFDSLEVGTYDFKSFTMYNNSGVPLIGNVTSPCGCFFVLSGATYNIAHDDSHVVTIVYSPTAAGVDTCWIETGAGVCKDVFCIGVGTQAAACSVEPDTLNFGTVLIGSFRDSTFTISNTGGDTLSGTVSETCEHYSIISGEGPYSLTAGQSVIVEVRFEPTASDTHTCTIETGSGLCDNFFCTGVGEQPASCLVSPDTLKFGAVALNDSLDLTFFITNIGGDTLRGDISEICDNFSLVSGGEPFALTADETVFVVVRFIPTENIDYTCTVETGQPICADMVCTGYGDPLSAAVPARPSVFALHQNHPNPFNPTTTITFSLPEQLHACLIIYDLSGRRIRTLVNEVQSEGVKQAVWDGKDSAGNPVSSGVYFYRLKAGGKVLTKKMVLLK